MESRPHDLEIAARPLPADKIRVQIIDSSEAFCDGLGRAVENDESLRLMCSSGSAAQVFDNESALQANVALIDVDLPDLSGIEIGRQLLKKQPEMKVLMLSHWDWDVYLVSAYALEAAGFLVHSLPVSALLRSIRLAVNGPIFSPDQFRRIQAWNREIGDRLVTLQPREWQAMWQFASGFKNQEVARQMLISENTVEKHLTSILNKLNINSRSKLLSFIFLNHLDALWRVPEERRPFYLCSGKKTPAEN